MFGVPEAKKRLRNRTSEIIQDYLYDKEEAYAYIAMYFEKRNGENQTKVLRFGAPSCITPDRYRSEPEGYDDTEDGCIPLSCVLFPRIVWEYADGTPWDGKTLSQVISEKKEGNKE